MHKWEAKISKMGEVQQCAHCSVIQRKSNIDQVCRKRTEALSGKLLSARANGDPEKYMAPLSVADAHEIGALLRWLSDARPAG